MIKKDTIKLKSKTKNKILVLGIILVALAGLFGSAEKAQAAQTTSGPGTCWSGGVVVGKTPFMVASDCNGKFVKPDGSKGIWWDDNKTAPPPPDGPKSDTPPSASTVGNCWSGGVVIGQGPFMIKSGCTGTWQEPGAAVPPPPDGPPVGTVLPPGGPTVEPPAPTSGLYDNLDKCSFVPPTSINGCFELVIYWIFYDIPSFLLGVAANFFNVIVALTLSSAIYAKATFIGGAWTIVRDLSSIFFILVLLYIAVELILGLGGHDTKKMITKVIIMALLINFSMFFTEVVIDSSNILALVFYNKINVVSVNSNGKTIDYVPVLSAISSGVQDKDIAGGLMSYFDPTKLLSPDFFNKFRQTTYQWSVKGALLAGGGGAIVGSAVPILGTGLGAAAGVVGYFLSNFSSQLPVGIIVGFILIAGLLMSFAAYTFFMAGISFVSRLIELWILIIFSPFAFMSSTIPLLEHIEYIGWDAWWKRLLKVSFMAPIFMFFLYFIFMIIQTNIFSSLADRSNSANQGWMETIILLIIPALVILILLHQATKFAKKASGVLGEGLIKASGFALGAVTGTVASLGTATAGRAGAYLANTQLARSWESLGWGGEYARRGLAAVGSGSFDVRGVKIAGQTLAGATGIPMGEAQKGGFAERRKAQVESRIKRAKDLEVKEDDQLKQNLNRLEIDKQGILTEVSHDIEQIDKRLEAWRQRSRDRAERLRIVSSAGSTATTAEKLTAQREADEAVANVSDLSDHRRAIKDGGSHVSRTVVGTLHGAVGSVQDYTTRGRTNTMIGGVMRSVSVNDLEDEYIPEAHHEIQHQNRTIRGVYANTTQGQLGRIKNFFFTGGQSSHKGSREAAHKIIMETKIEDKGDGH